jgi:hypothetical protein
VTPDEDGGNCWWWFLVVARQTGQLGCCRSQAAWPQAGSTRTTSFAAYSSRHTVHLRFTLSQTKIK